MGRWAGGQAGRKAGSQWDEKMLSEPAAEQPAHLQVCALGPHQDLNKVNRLHACSQAGRQQPVRHAVKQALCCSNQTIGRELST